MTSLSEWQANLKRNWKAEIWDYDHYLPDESGSCLYCLTEKQAELLRGIVQPIAWKTRWFSPADTAIDQDLIEQFRDNLTRRLMMPCGCDDTGTLHRFTPNGHFQSSSDGGATWTDDTTGDPRTSATQFPPYPLPSGDSPLCEWADSIANLIKTQFVDELSSTATISNILAALTGLLGLLFALEVVGAIIFVLASIPALIFAFGVSAMQAAFTSEVWDRLRCNINMNMGATGFDQAGVDAVYSKIATDETGIVVLVLQAIVAAFGVVGMNNAANAGYGSPDAICCPTIPVYKGDECSATTPQLLTPVDGVYTLVGDCFHDGGGFTGYLANILFTSDPTVPVPPSQCSLIDNVIALTGSPDFAFRLDCDRALQFTFGDAVLYQYRSPTPFTMTFKIFGT